MHNYINLYFPGPRYPNQLLPVQKDWQERILWESFLTENYTGAGELSGVLSRVNRKWLGEVLDMVCSWYERSEDSEQNNLFSGWISVCKDTKHQYKNTRMCAVINIRFKNNLCNIFIWIKCWNMNSVPAFVFIFSFTSQFTIQHDHY